MNIRQTEREQTRKDYSNEFLTDLVDQVAHGHDPRNWIGLNCGVSMGRAFQVFGDRLHAGEL